MENEIIKSITESNEKVIQKAKELEKLIKDKSFLYYIKTFIRILSSSNWFLFTISIILLGSSVWLNISHIIIDNQNIVLGFIGIIATFVVVGNYFQVKEIEGKFESKTKEIERQFEKKVEDIETKTKEIEGKFESKTEDIEGKFEKIREESESFKKNLKGMEIKQKFLLYFQEANVRFVTAINIKKDGDDEKKKRRLQGAFSRCLNNIELLNENINLVDEEYRRMLIERMLDIVLEAKNIPECKCTRADSDDIKYKIRKIAKMSGYENSIEKILGFIEQTDPETMEFVRKFVENNSPDPDLP
jgi:hypothetical protein